MEVNLGGIPAATSASSTLIIDCRAPEVMLVNVDPYWRGVDCFTLPGFETQSSTTIAWLHRSLSISSASAQLLLSASCTQPAASASSSVPGRGSAGSDLKALKEGGGLGLLVIGPEGSGKSTFVRALCRTTRTHTDVCAHTVRGG
jgi:hypothetical protein